MPHVLIVDDDANTREALVEITRADGYTSATAGSMRDAQLHIARQRPDLVLIDLRLPDGNGMDLFNDIE
ncbi:MAG: response regulator, partial [Burkholderiaceae bacterium]